MVDVWGIFSLEDIGFVYFLGLLYSTVTLLYMLSIFLDLGKVYFLLFVLRTLRLGISCF